MPIYTLLTKSLPQYINLMSLHTHFYIFKTINQSLIFCSWCTPVQVVFLITYSQGIVLKLNYMPINIILILI